MSLSPLDLRRKAHALEPFRHLHHMRDAYLATAHTLEQGRG